MANKRMFNIKIVDSDAFLDMPLSTQALYFHLNMRADDDGFIGNPKRIKNLVGASDDDLKLLIAKRFLLTFEDGVIVIKHWRLHNTLSSNRYTETVYTDEKKMLLLKENKSYSFTSGVPLDDRKQLEMSKRQVRRTKDEQLTNTDIDKDIDLDKELDKDKDLDRDIDLSNKKSKKKSEGKEPTLEEIISQLNDKDLENVLLEFVKMRKLIKKPLTNYALEQAIKKMFKLGNGNKQEMIAIVNQSIENSYQGLFPIKKDYNKYDGGLPF